MSAPLLPARNGVVSGHETAPRERLTPYLTPYPATETATESDDQSLAARAERLDETPVEDHALTVALAGLNAIPVIGGVIATFISEYVPRRKQARLVAFVQDLERELEAERDRIDQEFVRTEEFAGMAEDVLDRVQQRKNEDKLHYWATLLAGVATTDRPPTADRDRLIETLDAVRFSNLRLLHVIATTREARPELYMGGVADTLTWKMPDIPIDEIRRDWDELARLALVGGYPSGTMTREGAGNLAGHVTAFGRQFVSLVKLEDVPPGE